MANVDVNFVDNSAPAINAEILNAIVAALNAKAESVHNHSAADINSGTLQPARGGTGVTSLTALATALGCAKIATGSYTGTGTYGSANPCSLTFSFSPQFLLIFSTRGMIDSDSNSNAVSSTNFSLVAYGQTYDNYINGYENYNTTCRVWSWNGKTARWYNCTSGQKQLNLYGGTYVYFAIE